MELPVTPRESGKKSETKKLRREGNIPAILYASGKEGKSITVDGRAFQKILRELPSGGLATQIFTLKQEGKEVKALVKDIQYKCTNYQIHHLDFVQIDEKVPVKVRVPLRCTGVAECAGIKLGGVLRQTIRQVRVSCLPKDIPSCFELDVREMSMGKAKKLSDIAIPKAVRPLVSLDEIALVIAKGKVA